MALVEIVSHIVVQFSNPKEALTFLESIEPKVGSNSDAVALIKVLQGNILLQQLNNLESAKVYIHFILLDFYQWIHVHVLF